MACSSLFSLAYLLSISVRSCSRSSLNFTAVSSEGGNAISIRCGCLIPGVNTLMSKELMACCFASSTIVNVV